MNICTLVQPHVRSVEEPGKKDNKDTKEEK